MTPDKKKEEAIREANLKIGSVYILIASSIFILFSLYTNKNRIIEGKEDDLIGAEINKFDYIAIMSRVIPKAILLYYAYKHFKPILDDNELLDTKEGRGLRNVFTANLLDSSSTAIDVYSLLIKDVTFY